LRGAREEAHRFSPGEGSLLVGDEKASSADQQLSQRPRDAEHQRAADDLFAVRRISGGGTTRPPPPTPPYDYQSITASVNQTTFQNIILTIILLKNKVIKN
jgi:hypothetical protein